MPMAIPLIAAYATVSAGIAATGFIGGMMIAGGVMTAVGTISGNKKLTRWGGILSLAGGVAGMATGAWSTAAEGVAAESMAGGYTNQMDLASDAFIGGASDGLMGTAGDALSAASGAMTAPVNPGEVIGTDLAASPPLGQAPPAVQAPPGQAPSVPEPAAVSAPKPSVATPQAPNVAQAATRPAVDTTGGALQPAMDWAKANPRLVQAGTGLLSAGMNYYGAQDAAKESMRLREEADQRARERINTSVAGVRVPTYKRKG